MGSDKCDFGYIVKFNSKVGSSVRTQNATKIKMIIPKKAWYIFEGWYKNSALTQYFDPSSNVTSNMTLYA